MASSTTVTKFAHLKIPLEDVLKATNNFHKDNIIGQGGFGTAYKGQLLQPGELIKIAALRLHRKQGEGGGTYVQFWTEISMLSDLKHTNLVTFIGYCDEKNEKIIITTYAPNGSLRMHLKSPNLTWTQRLKICVGVARVLSYLHYDRARGYGVMHLNINSASILLDENLEAKLSGFKVSIKQSLDRMDRVTLSDPIGTIGYTDPEIEKTRGVTHKSDVYSFGVVLFELLCGRETYIPHEANPHLVPLARKHFKEDTLRDVIPPDLWNQMWSPQSLMLYSNSAYYCTHEERTHRPTMEHILQHLEKALELQLRRENMGKNMEHMKIRLDDIYSTTHNLSIPYRPGYSNYFAWFIGEVDHFDKEKPSSIEGYKCDLPKRHSNVVIKKFLPKYAEDAEEFFFAELEMLAHVKHHNIVKIKGFCVEGSEMMLVIENGSNGSLQHAFGHKEAMRILTWEKRLKICIDIAHVLNYLHFEMEDNKVVIHGNIRSTNIGLDENWGANVDEFERAVFLPPNQDEKYQENFVYEKYYVDPEYVKNSMINRESDVYSFGVVLFEVLCGRKANDPKFLNESDEGLAHVAIRRYYTITLEDIIDPLLKGKDDENNYILDRRSFDTFCKIAYDCVAKSQDQRPTMKVVLKELEKALYFQQNKDTQRMSLEDIKLATQDFHDDNCIGRGGSFGKAYKGKVPRGDGLHNIVAKLLNTRLSQEEKLFQNELQILLEYKHGNIIGLVGYCDETNEKVIVYEYASRRSLDRYVNDASLTWIQRLNICIDVASALDFLHRGREATVVAHGDIKTTNILLDDDWKAKLSGFGLSLVNPLNQETNCGIDQSCGTPGYLDPLYIKSGSGFLTKEVDIYSFGVVLFEILCGRSTNAIHKYEGHYLPDFIRKNFEEGKYDEIVLEQIKEQIMPKSLSAFLTIAYQCLHQEGKKRPTSKEVLMELKKALEIQEERVPHPNMDHVVNRLRILSRELRRKNLEHLRIPISDIKLATNFFSEKHKVASWYDYTLYRAELSHFDKENPSSTEQTNKCESLKRCNTVIIKRISYRHEAYEEKHFYREVGMLTFVKHPNIVSLLGFCVEGSDMILIVDNASNGYLSQYLGNFNRQILNWEKRLKICIDVAHALCYLHFEMDNQNVIIHGDINSRHIALDENFGAKIADFWFSAFLPPNHKDEAIHYQTVGGAAYYIDPELEKTHKSKRVSDVYSFGVVLFEILCGRTAYDPIYQKNGGKGLAYVARQSYETRTLEDMIDPVLKEETVENNFVLKRGPNKDSLRTFIEIAHQCVAETQDQRPTMRVVVKKLEKALLFQEQNKDNPIIPLENIKQATQNFHTNNCIGGGGFGNVYKGNLQDGDGYKTIVAKRLDTTQGQGEQEFLSELQILLEYKHENVIGLEGYCNEKGEKIIVFKYAPRGSLEKYLDNASLTWVKRLQICIDVASALDFIHGGVGKQARVIHRDIKAANILLNHDWKAKLADFGLSLISPINQETNYIIDHACGTRGYLDPLYEKLGFLTIESDIYSFGVVLFEMLCGRSTFTTLKREGHHLPYFINKKFEEGKQDEVVMKQIREQMVPESLSTYQEISRQCLHYEREKRPATKNVLWQLKKALEFQNMPSTIAKCDPLKIPLEDVVKATNNFHPDNIIRHDGFGTTYKGRLLRYGRLMKIAAQRFDRKHEERNLEFIMEISMLSDLKHKNVISIIGYSEEKDEKIIITTYEGAESLGQHLNNPNLTWTQRLRICLGVARALSFLHYDEGRDYAVIHCNINSDTILLDENLEAKLSGFEISIKQLACYEDQVCLFEHDGTMGYMDPATEKTGGVTHKSDIYSFGVVLFEILCGRKAFIQNEGNGLLAPLVKHHHEKGTLKDIIHPDLHWNQMSPQSLLTYSEIAYSCLSEDRADRPNLDKIVDELEKALELQLIRENIVNNKDTPRIPLESIKQATQNFHSDNCIGAEGFSNVYIGNLQDGDTINTIVAKRLDTRLGQVDQQFLNELEILSEYKHKNVIGLVGSCEEEGEKIIVYEYASKRSLDRYLNDASLTWMQRLNIGIDIASALDFFHGEVGKKVIHRDIKSAHILLNEDWKAKLADFRLSLISPINQDTNYVIDHVCGTSGYLDPLYEELGFLTIESDIFSFGVVLFEMLCGRSTSTIHKYEGHYLPDFIKKRFEEGKHDEVVMEQIREQIVSESLTTFQEIAYQCLHHERAKRPKAKEVLTQLKEALELQVITNNHNYI